MRLLTGNRIVVLLALIAVLFVGLAIRAYWVAPRLVDVESTIQDLWSDTGDRPVTIEGAPSFQILPPEFILSNAKIVTERGANLTAEKIGFQFGLASLLTGQYRITSISLDHGAVMFPPSTPRPTKQTTEKLLIDFVSFFDHTPQGATFDDIRSINFTETQIRFGESANLTSLNATRFQLRRDPKGAISVTGELSVGGENARVDFAIGPRTAKPSEGRDTSFAIANEELQLSGRGETAFDQNLQFIGTISFSADRLKAVDTLLKNHLPPLSNATARLDAGIRFSFTALTLSAIQFSIGESKITGNVIADYTNSPLRLTGTLAATTLDLSDFVNSIGIKRDKLGRWSRDPLPDNLVPDMDMDLRLSTDTIILHGLSVSSVALSALLRNGKAELTLASANLLDGSLTGKIQLADSDKAGHYDARANAAFEKLDLEKLGIALFDTKRVSGIATGRIALAATGQSSSDMMSSLSGLFELASENSHINGIDLLAFLRRIESRPIGAVLTFKSGRSAFDNSELALDIRNGIANIGRAKLTKFPDLQVRLSGSIDLSKQIFAISGHALGSSAQSSERALDLPFSVQGPFDDPAFVPDFTNVSKQSGAISP